MAAAATEQDVTSELDDWFPEKAEGESHLVYIGGESGVSVCVIHRK